MSSFGKQVHTRFLLWSIWESSKMEVPGSYLAFNVRCLLVRVLDCKLCGNQMEFIGRLSVAHGIGREE